MRNKHILIKKIIPNNLKIALRWRLAEVYSLLIQYDIRGSYSPLYGKKGECFIKKRNVIFN